MNPAPDLVHLTRRLDRATAALAFAPPTVCVYRPLSYAREVHEAYLHRYGATPKRVLFLGMNPGPFGMAQTGVPFGEVAAVRDWLGLTGRIGRPQPEHPRRPVDGFSCPRSEVSGRRLWGLFADRFVTATRFAAEHLVLNYCPLVFLTASGSNRTPDQLPVAERESLYACCDEWLRAVVDRLQAQHLVGIGGFAANRLRAVLPDRPVVQILHPSPASPAANRGWAATVTRQLTDAGVWPS